MLELIPESRIAMYFLMAIVGAFIGSSVNFCIYVLGYEKSSRCPWSAAPTGATRKMQHYIPILGWLFRSDEETEFGKRFWLRPMMVELSWMIGLPMFYFWHSANGLTGGVPTPANWTIVWFVGHAIMFAFLFVATFIDFDQRIIPDGITVPGTIIALLLAAIFPGFRLPEVIAGLGGPLVQSVDFADGSAIPTWHTAIAGVLTGCAIFLVWILSLLPKFPLAELNFKSLKMVYASTMRFLQKNRLKVRQKSRRIGLAYLTIGFVGISTIAVGWFFLPVMNWDSLFGSIVGLGFGGVMVWLVRIVASHSLGQEAMGFGDVTLMAMIGAFLGWQASLIVFTLSPFAALAIVAANYLVTKENELAFGPYLCLGAVITVFAWNSLWPWALDRFFRFPLLLIGVLVVSLVMLMVMMLAIRKMKEAGFPEDESE